MRVKEARTFVEVVGMDASPIFPYSLLHLHIISENDEEIWLIFETRESMRSVKRDWEIACGYFFGGKEWMKLVGVHNFARLAELP